jgi:hypothetical protein
MTPNMPVDNSQKAHVDAQTQSDFPEWSVNLQFQLLQIRLFGEYICKLITVNINLSSN